MKEKSNKVMFDTGEDEYEYWNERKAKEQWTTLRNRLDMEDQLSSWKIHYYSPEPKQKKCSQREEKKFVVERDEKEEKSIIEEIERRRLERNAKKAKQLHQSHERNKKNHRKICLNLSEEMQKMRKSYSVREKKSEKTPLVLSSPKSYNLPNLSQSFFLNATEQRKENLNKIYSPQNKSSRFQYIRNQRLRKNKLLERKEGEEHMIWNLDEYKIQEKGKTGLVGAIRKAKMNGSTLNAKKSGFEDKYSKTYCNAGQTTDSGFLID